VTASPHNLFSYQGHAAGLSVYRVLALMPPDEGRITLSQLLDRVREHLDPRASEDDVKEVLWDLVQVAGLELLPGFDGSYVICHSNRSRGLYLDLNCTVSKGGVRSSSDILLRTMIPGQGERKNDDCGTVKRWEVCRSNPAHHARPIRHNCHRVECPECYHHWLSQAAVRVEESFKGFEQAWRNYSIEHTGSPGAYYDPQHITLSPSDEEVKDMLQRAEYLAKTSGQELGLEDVELNAHVLDTLASEFVDVLRARGHVAIEKLGLFGAKIFVHFFRIKPEYRRFANDLASQLNHDGPGPGGVRYNRYTGLFTMQDPYEYLRFSPHLHVLGYGLVTPFDDFKDGSLEWSKGWIYKNHSAERKQKSKKRMNIQRLVTYLLTHAPYIQRKLSIVSSGLLHSSKLKRNYVCPACGHKTGSIESSIVSVRELERMNGILCPECGCSFLDPQFERCPVCDDKICIAEPGIDDGPDLLQVDPDHQVVRLSFLFDYWLTTPPPWIGIGGGHRDPRTGPGKDPYLLGLYQKHLPYIRREFESDE